MMSIYIKITICCLPIICSDIHVQGEINSPSNSPHADDKLLKIGFKLGHTSNSDSLHVSSPCSLSKSSDKSEHPKSPACYTVI